MRAASLDATQRHAEGYAVVARAKLDDLIETLADTDNPMPVSDETGALVGEIDRAIVMRAMSSRS